MLIFGHFKPGDTAVGAGALIFVVPSLLGRAACECCPWQMRSAQGVTLSNTMASALHLCTVMLSYTDPLGRYVLEKSAGESLGFLEGGRSWLEASSSSGWQRFWESE